MYARMIWTGRKRKKKTLPFQAAPDNGTNWSERGTSSDVICCTVYPPWSGDYFRPIKPFCSTVEYSTYITLKWQRMMCISFHSFINIINSKEASIYKLLVLTTSATTCPPRTIHICRLKKVSPPSLIRFPPPSSYEKQTVPSSTITADHCILL